MSHQQPPERADDPNLEEMNSREDKESTSVNRALPAHETPNLATVLGLAPSNGHPEDDLTAYSPPEGGLVAWMAGEWIDSMPNRVHTNPSLLQF
jgi:hypothetical protein